MTEHAMKPLKAQQAADFLGVGKRMMYALAAPKGPIPCIRYSEKCMRFSEADLLEYQKSCLSTPVKPKKEDGFLSSSALSTGEDSGLLRRFRKAGIEPKRSNMTKIEQRSFTGLQLVRSKSAGR